jgi:hypothetical protein
VLPVAHVFCSFLPLLRPDKHTDDPADIAAVSWAEKHMGDYKLKSDPHYVVPENQRVNAERKRRQMVLLQESVHYIKMALNERFLALRDLKARIIKNIKKDNIRLREINTQLGRNETLFEPELDPAEWPEHRELFTAEDLRQFDAEREAERARAARAGKGSMFGGGAGDGDEGEQKKVEGDAAAPAEGAATGSTKEEGRRASQRASLTSGSNVSAALASNAAASASAAAASSSAAAAAPVASASPSEDTAPASDTPLPPLSPSVRQSLEDERTSLLEKMSLALSSFDGAILKLRREKFKLDSDLKSTDLKVLTLFQELNLLKDFEENENRLFSKLSKARASKAGVVGEMSDCERQLSHVSTHQRHNQLEHSDAELELLTVLSLPCLSGNRNCLRSNPGKSVIRPSFLISTSSLAAKNPISTPNCSRFSRRRSRDPSVKEVRPMLEARRMEQTVKKRRMIRTMMAMEMALDLIHQTRAQTVPTRVMTIHALCTWIVPSTKKCSNFARSDWSKRKFSPTSIDPSLS